MTIGQIIGTIAGAVIGWFLGGPYGAAMGASVGYTAGSFIDPMVPDVPGLGAPDTSDLSISTAEEGLIVTELLGTSKMTGNIIWYGGERVEEVTMEAYDVKYVTEYKYYLSWALGICLGPIDKLHAIYNGDDLVWYGELECPASGGEETIVIDNFGSVTFYFGTDDQTANTTLGSLLEDDTLNPPNRHQCWAFFDDCYIGDYNLCPSMFFIVTKRPDIAFNAKESIGRYDYNPAHAIYYTLNELTGLPASYLNAASFSAVAETLSDEYRGVGILFDTYTSALSYIEGILTHIDGILRYSNDGTFHLKLRRADADVDDLPSLDESVMLDTPSFNRSSWLDTINQLYVQYPERVDVLEDEVEYEDLSLATLEDPASKGVTWWGENYVVSWGMKTSDNIWLWADYGEGYFDGDFTMYLMVEAWATEVGNGYAVIWGLANDVSMPLQVSYAYHPYPYIAINMATGAAYCYFQLAVRTDSLYYVNYSSWTDPLPLGAYYLEIIRDEAEGTYGTLYLNVYSDAERTVLAASLEQELVGDFHDYRYMYYLSSYHKTTNDYLVNYWIGDLDLSSAKTIDYADSSVSQDDPANQEIVGKIVSKTIKAPMYQLTSNASWLLDRMLAKGAYPLATVQFPANRDAFRLEVGDLFKFDYDQYGISNMVLRIEYIAEESLESEVMNFTALEDIDYLSSAMVIDKPASYGGKVYHTLNPYDYATVIEAPHVLAGDAVAVVPLVSRKSTLELGYYLYMSVDGGGSYMQIAQKGSYNPHGLLVAEYPADTITIDDTVGFQIDFSNADVSMIESVSRSYLFTGVNMAVLGDEIISFQTITPVSGNRYAITGIFRGRYDTEPATHAAGTEFWYIGEGHYQTITHGDIITGASRKFKLLPYTSQLQGDLSAASEISLTIAGRAKKPYKPINFFANGEAFNPFYSTDIVLTWSPRVRGEGAGVGDPDSVTDAEPTWEGLFKIEVYVSDVLVRTATAIDDDTWTYTEAMNLSDNGSLASALTFKLSNYITSGGYTYETDQAEVSSRKTA